MSVTKAASGRGQILIGDSEGEFSTSHTII